MKLQKKLQRPNPRVASRSTLVKNTATLSEVVETIYNPNIEPEERLKETVPDSEFEHGEKKEEQMVAYTYLISSGKGRFTQSFRGPDKCFFRMWKDDSVIKFEFSGNIDKALANLNAVFDDTCYLQGSQMNARDIVNITPGELDEKLNIKKKAVIKLVE
jgi:hypothetical protein